MSTTRDTTLLTPRQVSDRLQFTTARPIYKLIKSGELPASKIGGRLLIEASDVEALIEHARQRASEPRPGGLLGLERGR
jgi:excisionase family DNA binding protein